jgi:hypothetical protein
LVIASAVNHQQAALLSNIGATGLVVAGCCCTCLASVIAASAASTASGSFIASELAYPEVEVAYSFELGKNSATC